MKPLLIVPSIVAISFSDWGGGEMDGKRYLCGSVDGYFPLGNGRWRVERMLHSFI
jgi:hypothetical protein